MSPEQFLAQVRRQPPASVYLFLGPEAYYRPACRQALVERILAPEEREEGFVRHSLDEVSLAQVIDDARSLSLFAPRRVIWVGRSEAALPKGKVATAAEEDDEEKGTGDAKLLAGYLRDPTPGVVLVFDSARFEFDGEDKARSERVRKFYSAIPNLVELPRLDAGQCLRLAQKLSREANLRMDDPELDLLVEAVGASATAIVVEIEKLRLFAGDGGAVTAADIARLVPRGGATTIYALVSALGRNDRSAALDHLDTLVREGEYLPLALAFLSTQFRQALVAKELNLRSVGQMQGYFSKAGIPMWPSRAEQVLSTVSAFSAGQIRDVLLKIASADRNLRDARPDDRTIMEEFVVSLSN
jgi:DNA polymerase-3 subunit delta